MSPRAEPYHTQYENYQASKIAYNATRRHMTNENVQKQPSKRRSSKTSDKTSAKRSEAARRAWEKRRARQAAEVELAARFTPQRPSQQPDPVEEQLDRSLMALAARDAQKVNWLHISMTASLVANVAFAVALWG